MSDAILSIRGLRKTYGTGVDALKSVDLDIRRGEIFALLVFSLQLGSVLLEQLPQHRPMAARFVLAIATH